MGEGKGATGEKEEHVASYIWRESNGQSTSSADWEEAEAGVVCGRPHRFKNWIIHRIVLTSCRAFSMCLLSSEKFCMYKAQLDLKTQLVFWSVSHHNDKRPQAG